MVARIESLSQFELSISSDKHSLHETLYRRYYQMVYRICYKMMKNAADAEDITQDVFIRLFDCIANFRGQSSFTCWLYRITVNQVLMKFRKGYNRKERITDDGILPDLIETGSLTNTEQGNIDRLSLNQAIAKLPRGYRQVFLLHDVYGYEHHEVAKILSVNSGTSKSQLHKARVKIREELARLQSEMNLQSNSQTVL